MDARKKGAGRGLGAFIAPLVLLGAPLAAALILRRPPLGAFGYLLAIPFAAVVVWILTSTLWPARADRGCPRCGRDALRRADPRTTHGVRCEACGWEDDSHSAWLLAEEEGPLEDVVLRERRTRRRRSGAKSAVDSARAPD